MLQERLPLWVTLVLVVVGVVSWLGAVFGGLPTWTLAVLEWASRFSVVFLGIFIEAAPFLLLGTLASGIVEVFVERETLASLLPRGVFRGALAGSLLGLFFPVCECGVVPFARRLMRKGAPAPVAIATLLAAPVINPIVIASTLVAFGPGWVLWGRLGVTLAIAMITGMVFGMQSPRLDIVKEGPGFDASEAKPAPRKPSEQIRQVLVLAADEFFEMGRFLVMGSLLAALMQTVARQSDLLSVGQGPVLSVVVMVILAVLLSICSTVDAFIALAFVGTFTSGSILAFLVYGPMVDIKSTLMFLRVFRPREVAYLVLLPLLLTLLAAVAVNYF